MDMFGHYNNITKGMPDETRLVIRIMLSPVRMDSIGLIMPVAILGKT